MKQLIPFSLATLALAAHADDVFMPRVTIDASRISQLGIADSAAEGTVTQRQLEARTAYRPGELLEATPGLVVSQHSGEGKANQFYLRGFNLDHGTDLATTVDGMPVNQRSHAHGQGWTDLNFVIPELAARLDYRKGPYSAQYGDFASAGATDIAYANRLTRGIANLTVGQHDYGRALLAASPEAGSGNLLYALETMHNDGPFTQGDNYRKVNGMLRYSEGYVNNGWSVTAMGYRAKWNATDQIPERAVAAGTLGRFDAVDPTDGGSAYRYSLSGTWQRSDDDQATKLSAYAIANRLDLFSNFTYYLDDPVIGDQFAQPDRRVTTGFAASHAWHHHGTTLASTTTVGVTAQNDNIHNGLYATKARQVTAVTREDHIVETSGAVYVENQTRWSPVLRTTAGLRADRYRFDVTSDRAVNSGKASDSLLSPSVSIAFGPWARTEFYVNAGTGFHSNDARGTVITVDPKTNQPADRVTPLARSRGLDLGVRSEWIRGLQTSLSLFRLDFDSELVFVGDAGTTEAGRPSRRHGIEFSNYYKPFKWLALDADLAYARGRYRDADPAGDHIPGAVEGVAQLAATVTPQGPWSGALRLRWFGPRPLVEDNSVRSAATMTVNGRIAWQAGRNTRIELEAFNLTNRRDAAIAYYYASRLAGEAQAVDDVHFHPIESRSLRLSLTQTF
ncbi:outer membrane receptor protein involved in Fe transport [Pseudoduganella flava]|uniref:Outer membrane receptor protein involved in Fe transport n=1 Tax=Pseudoduganella flava TaxID=871742 RepID=A0A562PV75_9BURK|nr:TonB-dependent receptor [Pseudoduganella flava]QGZ39462.1 TonB-dependent receptor plug domain-containing protein [Pseudoduganella flava]TWI48345.1 outer membrane receptor protein involved in Fe transport [Pseudoduganella flava]